MAMSPAELNELKRKLSLPSFPRSARYDPLWLLDNLMGPNVLWLAESLVEVMDLKPGMRVLDMGCGKAVSSIFLAREFDVEVYAVDLWIPASDNWQRVKEAGVGSRVVPIHAEAHALPFADGFFDAAVSLDAYHYFGTDDLYTSYFTRFLRADAQVGMVCPGLTQEFSSEGLPAHLEPYWEADFFSFHSPGWWKSHWERSGCLRVERADLVDHGADLWLHWLQVCTEARYPSSRQEADMLRADGGRTLGFTRVVARKEPPSA